MKHFLAMFDMDGTLFDTQKANFAAYKAAYAAYGYTLTESFYEKQCFGKHFSDFGVLVTKGERQHIKEIHQKKKEIYPEFLDQTKVNIHLFNMITSMKTDYHIALVTTAARKSVMDILAFYDKRALFDLIVSGEDAEKTKPDPEAYLKAMAFFDMKAEQSIIFEDSDIGLMAARATGASVIKVEAF